MREQLSRNLGMLQPTAFLSTTSVITTFLLRQPMVAGARHPTGTGAVKLASSAGSFHADAGSFKHWVLFKVGIQELEPRAGTKSCLPICSSSFLHSLHFLHFLTHTQTSGRWPSDSPIPHSHPLSYYPASSWPFVLKRTSVIGRSVHAHDSRMTMYAPSLMDACQLLFLLILSTAYLG